MAETTRTPVHVLAARLRARTTRARLARLERELEESRRLQRRVAELTDVVTELLVPLARRDDQELEEVLARYRSTI